MVLAKVLGDVFKPEMVAGHSLGEFSALVANETLSFEDGLKLVSQRAQAMQKACELQAGTMAAVLGLEDSIVEEVCHHTEGVVVAANYNCPGQLVISGEINAINKACETLKEKGARRALVLPVGGAFHSPLMEPAALTMDTELRKLNFSKPIVPIVQNIDLSILGSTEGLVDKLVKQICGTVRWRESLIKMAKEHRVKAFFEIGPGKVLAGTVKRTIPGSNVISVSLATQIDKALEILNE